MSTSADDIPTAVSPHHGPWAHRLGHLLWEVSAATNILIEAEMAPTGLSPRSLGILDKIAIAPGATVSEIARLGPVTQQAVSQTVARLEKLGLVERRLGSRRGVGLHLTDAGVAARENGDRCEQASEAQLQGRLGDELFTNLRASLELARERLVDVADPVPPKEK